MSREQNYGMSYKMKASLADMEDLYREVSENLFIPRRFRKAPFTKELKDRYLLYLSREITHLKGRIEKLEQGQPEGRHP